MEYMINIDESKIPYWMKKKAFVMSEEDPNITPIEGLREIIIELIECAELDSD